MTGARPTKAESPDMPTALRLIAALRSATRLLATGATPSWCCAWAAGHHGVDNLTLASLLLDQLA